MRLNIIRLQGLVHAGLIVAVICASLLAGSLYYFYFKFSDREAAVLGVGMQVARLQSPPAVDELRVIVRMENKQSLPAIAPGDVKDVFNPTRVPGRD